jgi:hypothetical protein
MPPKRLCPLLGCYTTALTVALHVALNVMRDDIKRVGKVSAGGMEGRNDMVCSDYATPWPCLTDILWIRH